MTKYQVVVARLSLSLLWGITGLTSLFFAPDIGYSILESGGISGALADFCVISGSIVDLCIAIWILTNKYQKLCCYVQIVMIITFTVLLTMIAPMFWLHPFGPLTKNLPILVLIWVVYLVND